MQFPKGRISRGNHSSSTTPGLLNLELRQLGRLIHIAQDLKRDIGDRYQALGMIEERLGEIDRRFCSCYYHAIPDNLPVKTYEELTETIPKVKVMAAGVPR